jgi:hypothetical protein
MATTTFRLQRSVAPAVPAAPPTAPAKAAEDPPPESGTATVSSTPNPLAVLLAFVLVGVAWWVATNVIHDPDFEPDAAVGTPVEGLTIFAVFFVAASAIERLIEPLTLFYGQDKKADLDAKAAAAKKAVDAAYAAQTAYLNADAADTATAKAAFDTAKTAASTALDEAASAKGKASAISGNRAVVVWASASAIGIVAASFLKLYLLKQVGIASPPRSMELLATGLIIGAGTKPMHDLVKLIEKRKENQTAAASGGGAATTP